MEIKNYIKIFDNYLNTDTLINFLKYINTLDFGEATERCQQIIDDWKKVGHRPKGFRAPGWGVTQDSANAISNYYKVIFERTNLKYHDKKRGSLFSSNFNI